MEEEKQKLLTGRLNETGFPFQEWCYETIKNDHTIKDYSFTFPPSKGNKLGISSSIDLLSLKIPKSNFNEFFWIWFIIECKKAKKDIKNWFFVKTKRGGNESTYLTYKKIHTQKPLNFILGYLPLRNFSVQGFFPGAKTEEAGEKLEGRTVLYGCESNNLLKSLNRNNEEKIYKSVMQSMHACRWLESRPEAPTIKEVGPDNDRLAGVPLKEVPAYLFVPMVVTTANLYVSEFDASKVDEGEIDPNKIKWEEKEWVVFDLGLPDYLQYDEIMNRAVFIVNHKHFEDFYQKFSLNRLFVNL